MIDSFVLASSSREIENKYRVKNFYPELKIPLPKILSAGDEFWTMTFYSPSNITVMQFGYKSERSMESESSLNFFVVDPYEYFINSRLVSGNDPKRCLVIVDAFFVRTTNNQKYLIHLQNKERAIGLAAMFDYGINFNTGVPFVGFVIFTVHSSPMFQKAGIAELPVILTKENAHIWIGDNFQKKSAINLFNADNDRILDGYPVHKDIFAGPVTWDQLQPGGERLNPISSDTRVRNLEKEEQPNVKDNRYKRHKDNIIYLR